MKKKNIAKIAEVLWCPLPVSYWLTILPLQRFPQSSPSTTQIGLFDFMEMYSSIMHSFFHTFFWLNIVCAIHPCCMQLRFIHFHFCQVSYQCMKIAIYYLSILLLTNIWIIFRFFGYQHLCTCFFCWTYLFFLSKYLRVELMGHKQYVYFPSWLDQITSSTAEHAKLFATLAVVCLFIWEILLGMKWHHIVLLICASLLTSEVDSFSYIYLPFRYPFIVKC